jgi:sigma-B regulation protein RsbU (phosphoserine phosphatase)
MKMKTLRGKVLATILLLAIIPLAVLGTISMVGMSNMRDTASSDGRSALIEQISLSMETLAAERAALVDEKLTFIRNQTLAVKNYAELLYATPEAYAARPVDYLNPQDENTLTPHIKTAEGLSPDDVYEELNLLGNATDVLRQFAATDVESIGGSYIGTETGLFVVVDKLAAAEGSQNYDPRTRGWYVGAKEKGDVFWTPIFTDASGRGASVSCAAPIYAPDGTLKGVAGSGADMQTISPVVTGATIGETGYAFLLDETGKVVISPHTDDIVGDENGLLVGEDYLNSPDDAVRSLGEAMVGRRSGVVRLVLGGVESFVAFHPLTATEWSLGVVVPVSQAVAPADALVGKISDNMTTVLLILVSASLLAIAAAVLLSVLLSGRITKPVLEISACVDAIALGDLDTRVYIQTGDELQRLGQGVNKMVEELYDYITNLAKVTADKERISTELSVATNIQASMLPRIFPPWPNRNEVDIYASMLPAKEVGGDFYDFFFSGEDNLYLVMADVSGKGVPAALFMVIAKTLLKNNAQAGLTPSQTLSVTNNVLCQSNDAGMFVTVFLGCLNVKTGELTYSNAGHNPPLIRRAGGKWEYMTVKPGFVLAGMEDMRYRQDSLFLSEGDQLFLYTDGVTEAVNTKKDLFGEPRLLEVANKHASQDIDKFTIAIKAELDAFAGEAEQADDITTLTLTYNGADAPLREETSD